MCICMYIIICNNIIGQGRHYTHMCVYSEREGREERVGKGRLAEREGDYITLWKLLMYIILKLTFLVLYCK